MAYNPELKNGSDFNGFKIPQACTNVVKHNLYVEYGGCTDVNELRALFDQVLSFFLKVISINKNLFRPFPPKLGDGQEADLLKLFLTIRRIGSYELVSENNLWEFVARECGLEIGLVASLKLIYIKYLKELDQWLIKGGFENVETGIVEKLDLLSRQLGKSLVDVKTVGFKDDKKKKEGTLNLDFSRINDDDEKFSDKKCELSPKVVKKVGVSMVDDEVDRNEFSPDNVIKNVIHTLIHDHNNSDDDVMLNVNDDDENDVVSDQKRKRDEESVLFFEMLDWVTNAAKDPHDLVFETSKKGDKLKKQALLARRALFVDFNVDLQKKNQKMHPSMYEDDDKLQTRSSRRTTSAIPIPSRIKRQRTESEKNPTDRFHEITESQDHQYNLGPLYQAQVPPWTGGSGVINSDPKWVGTQMWPPPNNPNEEHNNTTVEIGQGRECVCGCVFPGSAECVRFHIAENRLKVKRELGQLFYKWKFTKMGEEVSLSWEPEEEKRFKNLVVKARYDLHHSKKSRREIMNNFWKKCRDLIPGKRKENVVSYYFNVFVLRRRSYQNRVTPNEIDSDNDEEEVGSVGDRFGYEKVNGLLLKCSENLQCTDLES